MIQNHVQTQILLEYVCMEAPSIIALAFLATTSSLLSFSHHLTIRWITTKLAHSDAILVNDFNHEIGLRD